MSGVGRQSGSSNTLFPLFSVPGFLCPVAVVGGREGWGVVVSAIEEDGVSKFRSLDGRGGSGRIVAGSPSIFFGHFAGPAASLEFVRLVGFSARVTSKTGSIIRPVGLGREPANLVSVVPNCSKFGHSDPSDMSILAGTLFFELELESGKFLVANIRRLAKGMVVAEDRAATGSYDLLFGSQLSWLNRVSANPVLVVEEMVSDRGGGADIKISQAAPGLRDLFGSFQEAPEVEVAKSPEREVLRQLIAAQNPEVKSGVRREELVKKGGGSAGAPGEVAIRPFGMESPADCSVIDPGFSVGIVARVNLAGVTVHAHEVGDVEVLRGDNNHNMGNCAFRKYHTMVSVDPEALVNGGLYRFLKDME